MDDLLDFLKEQGKNQFMINVAIGWMNNEVKEGRNREYTSEEILNLLTLIKEGIKYKS